MCVWGGGGGGGGGEGGGYYGKPNIYHSYVRREFNDSVNSTGRGRGHFFSSSFFSKPMSFCSLSFNHSPPPPPPSFALFLSVFISPLVSSLRN